MSLLRIELMDAFGPGLCPNRRELDALRGAAETTRTDVIATGEGSAIVAIPEQILSAYRATRRHSELGQILSTAARLRDTVDRVVILASGGLYAGPRAILQACCHPYHNELSRAERGCRPRIYFDGYHDDNDVTQGLLDLLLTRTGATPVEQDWGIVVMGHGSGSKGTAAALPHFLSTLENQCGATRLPELVMPVTETTGPLYDLAQSIGCRNGFQLPKSLQEDYLVLSAAGLLPAAIMGLDVVQLLEGAIAMNEHFRSADFGANVVLQFVTACHSLARSGQELRAFASESHALDATGVWYARLSDRSYRDADVRDERRVTMPFTVFEARDVRTCSRPTGDVIDNVGTQVVVQVLIDQCRREALVVDAPRREPERLQTRSDSSPAEITTVPSEATQRADRKAGCRATRPMIKLHLAKVDEYHIGQLLQMLMISTAVKRRLWQAWPY